MNPSDYGPTGLFWTVAIPTSAITVNPGAGNATMQANDLPIWDYGQIENAIGGGKPRTKGTVTFKVVWSGVTDRVNIKNTDPVYGGFEGNFVRNSAQMEWTAITDRYTFVSDPLSTSFSLFAQVGQERNGSFFQ